MSQKYTLNVQVNSTITGNVCIFQEQPDTNASKILTLAWLSKRAHPDTLLQFEWNLDYCFTWGQTGQIGNKAKFKASQVFDANLSTKNDITFDYTDSAYTFSNLKQNNGGDNLYINQGGGVVPNDCLVGVGMSGAGTFMVESQPNLKVIFKPKPTYYVVFGDYEQGDVMDITELTNIEKVVFDGVVNKSITLGSSNTWSAK